MNKNQTRRTLLLSVLSLLLCMSMLVGTTFAWFTDSVTSANTIITSGNLDVEMYWADGTQAVPTEKSGWTDASQGAIFDYDNWEPGYTQVRHIKIANVGSLALKYKVSILTNGEVSDLADVIDVDYVDPAVQVANRTDLTDAYKLGTLTQVLAKLGETGNGELIAGASDTITIAFKMQETAGNTYMNKSIGTDFAVVLNATQLTSEDDSFDDQYDAFAEYDGEISSAASLVAALQNGGTYKVVSDISLDAAAEIPAGVTVNLDLNGKAFSGAAIKQKHVLVNNGTLTVVNGTISSLGADGGSAIVNNGTATLTNVIMNGAPFVGADGWWPSYAVNNSGTMTITDSTITAEHGGAAGMGGVLTLNNVNITVGKNGYTNAAVYTNGGEIIVNGGTYTNRAVDQNNTGAIAINGAVTVNAGTFNGRIENYYGTPVIKGGTFSVKPNAGFVAAGYDVTNNGDGTYTVKKQDIVYNNTVMGDLYTFLPTLKSGDVLILPAKTYVTTGTFTIPAGVIIKGEEGAEVIIRQDNPGQDNIFDCEGDIVIENITFETNRKGYAINGVDHESNFDITVINCKFKGLAGDKNWGVYKNSHGNLTIKNCTFDTYDNAICGVKNLGGSTTVITGCTFTNIADEAIGYMSADVPADFEATVIANNTGLTAENVIGW